MDKKSELRKIKEDMEADKTLPLVKKPEDVIPGEGNPDTKVIFIGEAGGYHESIQRRPFVGRAGMLLNQLLQSIELKREDVYITNMVKTRPPENRDPLPEELKAFGEYLDREIEIIKPKAIVTLGRFSMGKFLPGVKITAVHGKQFGVDFNGRKVIIIPMFHPAAALRAGQVMTMFKEDFLKLPEILKKVNATEVKQMELI